MKNIQIIIIAFAAVMGSANLMAASGPSWDHTLSPTTGQGTNGAAWASIVNTGSTGPAPLNYPYAECGVGSSQSPVAVNITSSTISVNPTTGSADINPAIVTTPVSNQLIFQYPAYSSPTIFNTGHAVEVSFPIAYPGAFFIGQDVYPLAQFHFHTPAEHSAIVSAQGQQMTFAGELHFVHQRTDGKIAVVGVLLTVGTETPAVTTVLNTILNNFPAIPSGQTSAINTLTGQTLNPSDLLPIGAQQAVSYFGSLTTPPCSEGVYWYILTQPIQVSQAHINQINGFYPSNNRFTQNTNSRVIQIQNNVVAPQP